MNLNQLVKLADNWQNYKNLPQLFKCSFSNLKKFHINLRITSKMEKSVDNHSPKLPGIFPVSFNQEQISYRTDTASAVLLQLGQIGRAINHTLCRLLYDFCYWGTLYGKPAKIFLVSTSPTIDLFLPSMLFEQTIEISIQNLQVWQNNSRFLNCKPFLL